MARITRDRMIEVIREFIAIHSGEFGLYSVLAVMAGKGVFRYE